MLTRYKVSPVIACSRQHTAVPLCSVCTLCRQCHGVGTYYPYGDCFFRILSTAARGGSVAHWLAPVINTMSGCRGYKSCLEHDVCFLHRASVYRLASLSS